METDGSRPMTDFEPDPARARSGSRPPLLPWLLATPLLIVSGSALCGVGLFSQPGSRLNCKQLGMDRNPRLAAQATSGLLSPLQQQAVREAASQLQRAIDRHEAESAARCLV